MNTLIDEVFDIEIADHKPSCKCTDCTGGQNHMRHTSGCNCLKCRQAGKQKHMNKSSWMDEILLELNSNQITSAVNYNRANKSIVGWSNYYDDIVGKVLKLNYSPDESAFAAAVADWQAMNGFTGNDVDGKLGRITWDRMKKILFPSKDYTPQPGSFTIEDFRQKVNRNLHHPKKGYKYLNGNRPISQINSIVLHQTGGSTSTNPNNFLKIPIHYVVLSDGRIIQLYNDVDYIQHADCLNSKSVGIEFVGTFYDDLRNCWWSRKLPEVGEGYKNTSGSRVCGEPTQQQIQAGRWLVKAISEKIPTVKYIYAHRQSSASRVNDPGPTVWLQVAEWAKRNLGFSNADDYTVGTGHPIPNTWKQGHILP